MTEDTIALRALLEKGSDATFLREMIGFARKVKKLVLFSAPARSSWKASYQSAMARPSREGD